LAVVLTPARPLVSIFELAFESQPGNRRTSQVSMSSTSIVIKCLSDARQNGALHGQITIGTLILQVQMPHANPERDMQAQVWSCH